MSDAPIFVVGVPRSGTTLLASMLAAHSRLACGPETAFFAELAAAGPHALDDVLAFATNTRLESESLLDRYETTAEELASFMHDAEISPVGVLEALGGMTARRAGKDRWIEKSPVHLLYVSEIRRWFPEAPIVQIVRDPRDVALSLSRVPWGPDDLVAGLLYWRRFHERSRSFFGQDPLALTVRYEELVSDPETTIARVCAFVGERPEPAMTADTRPAGDLVRDSETWKGNVGGAIDPSRVGRWRMLGEADRELADLIAGDLLSELAYPLDGPPPDHGWLWLHPRHEAAAGDAELRRALGRGLRLWPASPDERPEAGLLVGHPDGDDWLGRASLERSRAVLSLVGRVASLRLRGTPVTWRRPSGRQPRGLSAALLSTTLRPLTTVETADG